MWDSRGVGARPRPQPRSGGSGRISEGQLVGTSEGERNITTLAIDSRFSRRFGLPTGGWENYLHPSTSMAGLGQTGPPFFQRETCGGQGGAHAVWQAQIADHSVSQVGAARNPASRAEDHRERGRLTIGSSSVRPKFAWLITTFCEGAKPPNFPRRRRRLVAGLRDSVAERRMIFHRV
jgi:hypothetical protein